MPSGWTCDSCGQFFIQVENTSRITVSVKPRRYVAERTFCSLRCLDVARDELLDDFAWAAEREHDDGRRLTA